ncbi:BlaI/MecI/CopY family transcriptional regulator [Tautonia sp. JC769]|uniref:BlaI/MecI/CopY family transcriptional regulator n=1 Tax=Tautonia sp. JC769 TaxID=3232135 RepID=UPI00345AA0DE
MPRKPRPDALGARERQIMDAVYKLGEASVAQVLADLPDPPSYSAVRTMIRALEAKGLLQHRRDGTKYVYRARRSRESAARSAITHLMQTFFGGSAAGAVAAILDVSATRLTDEDLGRIEGIIDRARREGK